MAEKKTFIDKTVKVVEKDADMVLDTALDEVTNLFSTGKKDVSSVVAEVKKFKG